MTSTKNPALIPIMKMEPLIRDVRRIGAILTHMGGSPFVLNKEEEDFLATHLEDAGNELLELFTAAHTAAGGAP